MTTNFISLKSVLYNISLLIDDRYWNESKMYEWIARGLRQMNISLLYQNTVSKITVEDHKAQLPSDLKSLTMVAYSTNTDCEGDHTWLPMRLSSNDFNSFITCDSSIGYCTDCAHEFSVDHNLVMTTTLKEGTLLVSYTSFPKSSTGELLIPDNETLKEALTHYAMYYYWMSKYTMKEDGADQRMKFHLDMWNTLSKKALNLNLPDVNQLENIKNIVTRLAPRTNRFQQLFTTLGNRENGNY